MPKSSRPSDDIRKLLRPNAERLAFEIGGPDIFIDGRTSELVTRTIVLGNPAETRTQLDAVQRMQGEAMGIPVRWPSATKARKSGSGSGES